MHDKIQPELIEDMNKVAAALNEIFKPYGFCLLIFPFGENKESRMNYISNAARTEMLIALKEFIANNESGQPPVSQGIQ